MDVEELEGIIRNFEDGHGGDAKDVPALMAHVAALRLEITRLQAARGATVADALMELHIVRELISAAIAWRRNGGLDRGERIWRAAGEIAKMQEAR